MNIKKILFGLVAFCVIGNVANNTESQAIIQPKINTMIDFSNINKLDLQFIKDELLHKRTNIAQIVILQSFLFNYNGSYNINSMLANEQFINKLISIIKDYDCLGCENTDVKTLSYSFRNKEREITLISLDKEVSETDKLIIEKSIGEPEQSRCAIQLYFNEADNIYFILHKM